MSSHFRSLYSMLTQAWGGPFVVKHQTSSGSARKRKKVNKIKKLTGPGENSGNLGPKRTIGIAHTFTIGPALFQTRHIKRLVHAKFPIDLLFMISEFMPVCLGLFLKVWYLNLKVIMKEDLIKQNK